MNNNSPSGKAVLFDVDGTLLDTIPLIVDTYHYVFNKYLGHSLDEATILASIGTPLESMFMPYPADLAERMKHEYLEYNNTHIKTNIGMFRHVPQILDSLAQKGIPMGIVTSKRLYSATISLDVFDLAKIFPVIIAKESTSRHKPDPDPVFEAMRQMGLSDPGKIVFVGDSLHDLHCAKNAGCRSAIVDWTAMPVDALRAANPDLWLESPAQLLDLLEKL